MGFRQRDFGGNFLCRAVSTAHRKKVDIIRVVYFELTVLILFNLAALLTLYKKCEGDLKL